MTLPLTGSSLSLSQVNTENGYGSAALVSLNDNSVRTLATKITGTIGFNDLQGKSNDGLACSYYFNGTNNGIKLANTTNLVFGSSDFTIEFWMKANTPQSTYAMIMDSSTNNSGTGIGVGQNFGTSGKLSFFAQGGVTSSLISTTTVTDNTWRHIACVKSANTGMLFVNGVKEANTAVGAWSTVYNAYVANGQIGRSTYGGGESSDNTYTGWLSNLRVVKGRAIYTTNFTPPVTTLAPIPNTELLTIKAGNVVDESANNVALTPKSAFPTLFLDVIPPISATYPVYIGSSISNANVYNISKTAGWDANNGLVVLTVNTGVIISSTSTGAYAMDVSGGFYGGLKIINNGTILGRGGNGGNGGSAGAYNSVGGGGAGSAAGPALLVTIPVKFNNTNGRIAGGGGGGGGGGGQGGSYTSGSGKSATTVYVYSGGGGGGGGIGVSSGGSGGSGQGTSASGSAGTLSAPGGGGAGGVSNWGAGAGGTGGSYGSSGASGGYGGGNYTDPAPGAGGAAGTSIQGYSKITWISQGTINGPTSG